MKLTKGLNRDLDYTNQLPNTYRDANNLVLSKDGDRLESEKGSTKIDSYEFPSDGVILGRIPASDEVIIIVGYSSTSKLRFFRYKDEVLTIILTTILFEFDYDSPIQGEYKYNYNKELIILFYSDVDIPRILNIDNLGFEIDEVTYEFVSSSDEIFTRQFTSFNEPEFNLTSINATGGNLLSGIYQLSIQYKLLDDSYSNFSLLSNPIPIYKFNPKDDWYNIYANASGEVTSKSIEIKIANADTRFLQFRFGILFKTETESKAYITNDYYVSSNGLLISNFDTFTSTNVADLLVKTVNLSTIKASTVINKVLYLGDVEVAEPLKYQKYACNITSEFVCSDTVSLLQYEGSYKDETVLFFDKSYMPFEIYAFYIRFIRKSDGLPTDSFHIPGRKLTSEELSTSTDSNEQSIYGSTGVKNFHLNDYSGADDLSAVNTTIGAWENTNEQYSEDDEFDGTKDYDGVQIDDGKDLRTNNVRHHRFPSSGALQLGGYNMSEASTSISQDVEIELSTPIDMSNPCRFGYTNSTNGIGNFEEGNKFKNTTSGILTGNVYLHFRVYANGRKKIELKLHQLDSNGVSTVLYTQSQGYEYNPVLDVDQTAIALVLASNETLYLELNSRVSTGTIKEAIIYTLSENNKVLFTATSNETIGEKLVGKRLGIKFGNIYIPDYIKNECSHYEILYAERTTSNITILGQSLMTKDTVSGSRKEARVYPFDLLYNKPSLNVSCIKPELYFDSDIVTASSGSGPSGNRSIVYPISKSKYIQQDIAYTEPLNENKEEVIYLESEVDIIVYVDYITLVSIISFKSNVYTSFYNQELVRTGKLIPILDIGITDSGTVYGGDVLHNVHGVTTYSGDSIRYYLTPLFSISNIGYRYTDDDPINIFFPKYNMVTISHEGQDGNTDGNLDREDESITASIYKLHADTFGDSVSTVYIYLIHEYYGYENIINTVNNVEPEIIYNLNNNFISEFPYRVYRTLHLSTESLMESWRSVRPNEYYDSVYNKGEIVQLDHDDVDLLLEHKYALFIIKSLDELQINEGVVAKLGSSDIFDSLPQEIIPTDSGYVGCQSKHASFRSPFGNIIVDRQQGKIFLYDKYKVDEISKYGMFNWFESNLQYSLIPPTEEGVYLFDDGLDILFDDSTEVIYATTDELNAEYLSIDNPFNDLGITCAYDRFNERLLFTKNQDELNSAYSWTLSYYPKYKQWVSFHTILPNSLFNNRLGIYALKSITVNKRGLFKLVDTDVYTDCYEEGNAYPVSIDVCFAQPYNVDKNTLGFTWSTHIESVDVKELYDITFNSAIVYTSKRHSDYIELMLQTFNNGNIRNTDGMWKFNDFMDVLSDKTLKVVEPLDIDELQIEELAVGQIVTDWYDKSSFVDPYVIIRLYFNKDDATLLAKNMIINGGYRTTTDWLDTGATGAAGDGTPDWFAIGGSGLTSSISTGLGFTGNHVRLDNASTHATHVISLTPLPGGTPYAPAIVNGTRYYYSFKYRSNMTIYMLKQINGGGMSDYYEKFEANSGDPIRVEGSYIGAVFSGTVYHSWGVPGGFGITAGTWFELDEIFISDEGLPPVLNTDKIIINDIGRTAQLKGRI